MSYVRRDVARALRPLVCSVKERYESKEKETIFVDKLTEQLSQGKLKPKEYEKVLAEFYFYPEALNLKLFRVLEGW